MNLLSCDITIAGTERQLYRIFAGINAQYYDLEGSWPTEVWHRIWTGMKSNMYLRKFIYFAGEEKENINIFYKTKQKLQ